MTLLCKKITVVKYREMKTRSNPAEYYKESCGPKRAPFIIDNDDYYSQIEVKLLWFPEVCQGDDRGDIL
jgi:hypothetical protein